MTAAVQVGAELAGRALPLHRGDHLAADHDAADVRALGFLDEFLHQDVGVQPLEGLDHRLGRVRRLRQHHADALGAFQQLDHQRRAAAHLDQLAGRLRVVGEAGDRQADAALGEQLQQRSLSRERAIATESFSVKTPIISNCRTTALP